MISMVFLIIVGNRALLQFVGPNTQLLATSKLVKSFGDTPSACGGAVHSLCHKKTNEFYN